MDTIGRGPRSSNSKNIVRCEVLTTVNVKPKVQRAVVPRCLADGYQNFQETYCPRLHGREVRFMRQVPSKRWYISAELTDDRYVNKRNVLSTYTQICYLPNIKRHANTTRKFPRLDECLSFLETLSGYLGIRMPIRNKNQLLF
jgi:hypothetical protein